jgi:catechol 2,3-dioxygenase-like lactoylglutathione lyase family enzyme
MPSITGFHHFKLPVTDVERSRDWYERVLGFTVDIEFVEEGVLRGVGMAHEGMSAQIALRYDPDRAKAMSGFDVAALLVPTREDVHAWQARLDEAGEPHGGIVTGHRGGAVLVGLRDPDGIELRLYAD